jgi:AcrR family transcriptional regulator
MAIAPSADEPIDPRAARSRRSMIAAISELLTEGGPAAVTHQRVAERASVGRATVYRHFPTAADLLYSGLVEVEEPLLRHGTGPLLPWLRSELRRAAAEIGQANAVEFQAVLISRAQRDPAVAFLRDRLLQRSVAPLAEAVERAVAAGELDHAIDAGDLLALLLGPLIFRVVSEGRAATDEFIDQVIRVALGR